MDTRQTILVVEDSDEHFESVLRAFKKTGVPNPVVRCTDGDDALDYLFRRGRFADPASSPRPGVVLLDLNLPGTDGREVLEQLKAADEVKDIPVVVVTSSSSPTDIKVSYRSGASSYIIKPLLFDDFLRTVGSLKEYWFETVALPRD